MTELDVIRPDERWHPGIGDPTVLGWVTVFAYFGAALLVYRALRLHSNREPRTGGRAAQNKRLLTGFWTVVLFVILLLGINKQLDMQSWFTELARDLAKMQGWFDRRRSVQRLSVFALAVLGLACLAMMAALLRRVVRAVAGALVGLGFLATFIIARAASFHHVDQTLGAVRFTWLLELGGIALVAVSAWRQGRAQRT